MSHRFFPFLWLASCTADAPDTGPSTDVDTAVTAETPEADWTYTCPLPSDLHTVELETATFLPAGCDRSTTTVPCVPHRMIVQTDTTPDKLLVFLPGTGMTPNLHNHVGQLAALAGFRTVLLSYDTRQNVNDHCMDLGDNGCHGRVRDVLLFGGEEASTTPAYTVETSHAVVPRLLHLLTTAPWGAAFLNGSPSDSADIEALNSSKIVVGGFSMGAGNAARFGQTIPLHGVWMLDGAKDPFLNEDGVRQPSSWTTEPGVTEGCRYFSAHHTLGSEPSMLTQQFDNLGIPTGACDIDSGESAMACHRLVTSQQPVDGGTYHSSMARDMELPTSPTSGIAASHPAEAHIASSYLWSLRGMYIGDPACEASPAVQP